MIERLFSLVFLMTLFSNFLGAELVDSVLDVVRKEAEGCECLQGRVSIQRGKSLWGIASFFRD